MIKNEKVFSGRYSKEIFETLYFAYRPMMWKFFFFLITGFAGRVLLLANANVIGHWVDAFVKGTISQDTSIHYFYILIVMNVIGFLLTLIFRIGFSRLSALAVSQIYDETTWRTSRYPMSFFDQTPVGRVITRFSSDYGNVFRLFGGPLAEFLSIIFDLLGMFILMSVANPLFLPPLIFIALLNWRVFKWNQNHLRSVRRELSAARSPGIAHFSETTQGASSIRSFNRQNSFKERFERLDEMYLFKKNKAVRSIISFSLQMNLITALFFLSTALISIWAIQHELMSIGALGVAFGFILLSGNTVQFFFEWLSQFEEAMVGVERMNEYLRKPIELGARIPIQAQFKTDHWRQDSAPAHPPSALCLPVEFNHVSFRYSEELPWVLKDIHFSIKAGEKIGIVGRTGSGKSTLLQALFYLYPLSEGNVAIAGQSPKLTPDHQGSMDLEVYRRQLAYISQDPVLFKGSLSDNLDPLSQHRPDELFRVLHQVGLMHLAHEEGLKFIIDERGRNLSLGEKQLICMARCLLQNSPIVVMDEATSSVDPSSEEIMVRATQEFFDGRTQIIIAHRLSTLKSCDRILWLENGRVKILGPTEVVLPQFEKTEI